LLKKCLQSIKEKTFGVTYEIIVVDNASKDGSAEMVRDEFASVKLIESSGNLGFVRANNRASEEARGDFILYLNPDTELLTNAIFGMSRFLVDNREFGAVGCKLIGPDGKIQFTCASTFPTITNEICYLLFLNRIFIRSKAFSSNELDYWDHENSAPIECLSGACMMVRRELIQGLGGFDENLFMYAEDLDLCHRILAAGWKIYYLSTEAILHKSGASSKRKGKMFAAIMQQKSMQYFLKKNYGRQKAFEFRLVVALGSFYRVIFGILLIPILKFPGIKSNINTVRMIDKYLNIFIWAIGLRPS
jgi:hypothetical protein